MTPTIADITAKGNVLVNDYPAPDDRTWPPTVSLFSSTPQPQERGTGMMPVDGLLDVSAGNTADQQSEQ